MGVTLLFFLVIIIITDYVLTVADFFRLGLYQSMVRPKSFTILLLITLLEVDLVSFTADVKSVY